MEALSQLHIGVSGPEVRKLQQQLKQLGFNPGGIDGVFGRATDKAVREFQRSRKLQADGIVGRMTIELLNQEAPLNEIPEPTPVAETQAPIQEPQIAVQVNPLIKERILLRELGNTKIYAFQTDKPWTLPFDALVIPAGPPAGLGGRFASSFLSSLTQNVAKDLKTRTQEQRKSYYPNGIAPDEALVVPLVSEQKSLNRPEKQHIIVATVADQDNKVNTETVTRATRAILRAASEQGLSQLIMPLLGTGNYGLGVPSVATAILQAIANHPSDIQNITEITLVHPKPEVTEDVVKVAETIFKESNFLAQSPLNDFSKGQEFLAQSPLNDLPTGQDLLNIKTEVDALAEVLLMRSLEPPLVVGILGGWGSGKSHIIHLMQEKMSEIRSLPVDDKKAWACGEATSSANQPPPYIGHVYQITFDAWTYARSNLWSSLMETIFFEMNRQLALERQLKEAGVLPCKGGKIWKILNEMSDEERQMLIHLNLNEDQAEKLEKTTSSQKLENELLAAFIDIKEKQQEELRQNEENLKQEQEALEQKKEEIKQEVAKQVQDERALEPIKERLYFLMGDVFNEFKQQLDKTVNDNDPLSSTDIEWLKSSAEKLKSTRLITWSSIKQWAIQNWKEIVASTVFVLLTLIAPIVLMQAKIALIPSLIAAIAPLMPAIISIQNLLKTLRKWHESIEKSINDYQNRIEELREQKIQEKLNEPKIKQAEEKVKHLKVQVEEQRQCVIAADGLSVADFVNIQLEKGPYGKRLGLMQQVKNDLANLSQQLCLPIKNCGERYRQKVKRLQQLFPRGPARVVLFIDDLDRCPPNRVVEVLEAVQLLVKHPLFVVVLAIDERYIARALEKVYAGVLSRQGKPSGIDYIEKIIQIPYRVRPIARSALQSYLEAQIDYEKVPVQEALQSIDNSFAQPVPAPSVTRYDTYSPEDERFVDEGASRSPQLETDASPVDDEIVSEALPPQVIKFTQEEFNILLKCCEHVDLSPRTLKRLVNVYKLFKIVWFRSGKSQSMQEEPDVKKAIISFLALSGRYPSLMRSVFEDLEMEFEENPTSERELSSFFPEKPNLDTDTYLCREWNRLLHDVKQMELNSLTLQELGEDTFNMVRSFCFVGDIGYDPNDFKSADSLNGQSERMSFHNRKTFGEED
jgi:predicted KAP-like P-loop ATPase/peptidoglycan hydrolase-like protein with peptidoglycan-binding domain